MISHMWDIKLKATNEQDKQKLMDMDNRLVVTRRKRGGGKGEKNVLKNYVYIV